MAKPIRIVAADPHRIVLDGIKHQLERRQDVKLIAVAQDKANLMEILNNEKPDIVIMEIVLQDSSRTGVSFTGIELIKQAKIIREDIAIIVYTAYTNEFVLELIHEAQPTAVVTKLDTNDLSWYIDHVVEGAKSGMMFFQGRAVPRPKSKNQWLSDTETKVLTYIALQPGDSIEQVAASMNLAFGTVKTHLAKIYEKLGTTKRAEAVLIGLQRGILPPGLVLNVPDDSLGKLG